MYGRQIRFALAVLSLTFATSAHADQQSSAASVAFMAEVTPHSCSGFQTDEVAVAAFFVNDGIKQADLISLNRFGAQAIDMLHKFQVAYTQNEEAACIGAFNVLGPKGLKLVNPVP